MKKLRNIVEGFFQTSGSGMEAGVRAELERMGVKEYPLDKWVIHEEDGTVDAGTINITNKNIEEITVKFGKVDCFNIAGCAKLKSLKNCPKIIGTDFSCGGCIGLKNLDYLSQPDNVGVNYHLYGCIGLKNLNGLPESLGVLDISGCNGLMTLEGSVKQCKELCVDDCRNLKTFLGCPEILFKLNSRNCWVTSLHGLPEVMPVEIHTYFPKLKEWDHTTKKFQKWKVGSRWWDIKTSKASKYDVHDVLYTIKCKVAKTFEIDVRLNPDLE